MSEPRIIERKDGTVLIERFSPIRRVEHIIVLTTFVVLVLTGLPQKFEGAWTTFLLNLFGGLDSSRFVHRVAGIVFTLHAVVHLVTFVAGVVMGKMRLTLLPTVQDLRDARENLLYYFGFREQPPALPKFDYRQKFEYLGMVLGGLVMVFSGLMLLYPQTFASWIPGQLIPAARVAHSNEAMLALLVLVVWHVYGSHLSPEVFPMDKSIFTGYLTREELHERHLLEYRRLFPDGETEIGEAEERPEVASDEESQADHRALADRAG